MGDNLEESEEKVLSGINELAYSENERAEYVDTLENGINLEQEKAQEFYDQIEEETTLESEEETALESLTQRIIHKKY